VEQLHGSSHVRPLSPSVSLLFANRKRDSGRPAYDKIISYIEKAKKEGGEVLIGGTGDDSKGYFVKPTVILTKDPKSVTMREEIFGPVITTYVYEDEDWEKTFELVDTTTSYGLTGSMCVLQTRFDRVYTDQSVPQLLARSPSPHPSDKRPQKRRRQRLLQRKVHRRRCRSTALWWCTCEWYQRQGWKRQHLLPIRQPA
jgi:Aldehyde dehydrogenase family